MKRIITLLLLTLTIISCTNSNKKEIAVDAAIYGLNEKEDATPVIFNALNACREMGASKLIIPKGTYHFYRDKAFQKYCAVSNNDNGIKRIAFPIIDFDGFEIDAQGSEFIFHGMIVPVVIERSKNITLKGFSVDYDKPFYGQAQVVASNPSARTFDVKIGGEWEYELHDKNLYFSSTRGWLNPQKNLFFDPTTKATVYNVNKYKIDPWNKWINESYTAEELEKGIVRIHVGECNWPKDPTMPEVGWLWVAKGGDGSRLIPGMHIFNAFNVHLEDINLYHTGAMGLIAERSGDISLENFNVKLREGSNRIVSSTADATHFVNCKGLISFNNCLFENMLDDATNVHGIYTKITDIIDENTIGVNRIHFQQWGFQFATPGDHVYLNSSESLSKIQENIVKEVKDINEEYMIISFQEKLDENIKVGDGVENVSWCAEMKMTNCTVRQNRARSILISTRAKVLVENCSFSSMMAAIRMTGDMNYWYESGPVEDVVIRNNTFSDLCSGGKGNVVLLLDPIIKDITKMEGYYHRNITIEDNTIKTFDRGILYAKSIDGLVFKNNTIEQTDTYKPLNPDKATIEIVACKNVEISGNLYKGDKDANIIIDELSKEVKVENNKGFE